MLKGASGQYIIVVAWDTIAREFKEDDEENISAVLSQNGATAVAVDDEEPIQIIGMSGVYAFLMTSDETNADLLVLQATSTTDNILIQPVAIYTRS